MKGLILSALLLTSSLSTLAQSDTPTIVNQRYFYARIEYVHSLNKAFIDYGEKGQLLFLPAGERNKEGVKIIKTNSIMDLVNQMIGEGWEYVNAYSPQGQTTFIIRKKI